MADKIHVVLVHGAWADGSSWSGVIPRLLETGYDVTAGQIPLTSLGEDAGVVRRILALQKGPTVLVGHSYGGTVISEAAADAPHVTSLVYISAFANDEGETLGELNARVALPPGPSPLRFNDAGFVWIDPEAFPQVFAQDVDPTQARIMAAVQKPIAAKVFGEKAGKPAWKSIPSWYLMSEGDRMIAPETQRFMANRMGAKTRTHHVDHSPMYTSPEVVVSVILEAARETLAC